MSNWRRAGITFAGLSAMIVTGAALFHVSQAVLIQRAENLRLEKAIEKERRTIRILEAEWAYLTRPQRLENLAARHLEMHRPAGAQIYSSATNLPEPDYPRPPGVKPDYKGDLPPTPAPRIPVSAGAVIGAAPGAQAVQAPHPQDRPQKRSFSDMLRDVDRGSVAGRDDGGRQ